MATRKNKQANSVHADLDKLLDRLQQKSDEGYGQATLTGHAIGKSNDSLHLAITTGIVKIPLDQIEKVTPLRDDDPTWVSIDIARADAVVYLTRTQSFSFPGFPGGGGTYPGFDTHTPTFVEYIDTVTITGNSYDATDDTKAINKTDDYIV